MPMAIDNIEHCLPSLHSVSSLAMSSTPVFPSSLRLAEGLAIGLGLGITTLLMAIRLWTKLRLFGKMLAEDCECTTRIRDRHAK